MEKMDKTLEGILEYLKRKGKLTELENDILLATQICQSSPFDSEAAKKKIMEFNAKYREVCSSILVTPGIKSKPLFDMKDEEIPSSARIYSILFSINFSFAKYLQNNYSIKVW